MGQNPTEPTAVGGDPGSAISTRRIDRPEAVIALFCAAAGGGGGLRRDGRARGNASPGGSYWKGGLALSGVAAGVGWCVGFAVGLVLTTWTPPTDTESWVLRRIATFFLLAGFTHWWVTQDIVPPLSHELRFAALERAIRLDAVPALRDVRGPGATARA